jgi:hypothetical protein
VSAGCCSAPIYGAVQLVISQRQAHGSKLSWKGKNHSQLCGSYKEAPEREGDEESDPCDQMGGLGNKFVFIHAEQGGKLTNEDQKLVRSRSKPAKYKRRVVKDPETKWISVDGSSFRGGKLLQLAFPVSPSAVPQPQDNRPQAPKTSDAELIRPASRLVSPTVRYLPLVQFAEDLDSSSIGILHSSLFALPSPQQMWPTDRSLTHNVPKFTQACNGLSLSEISASSPRCIRQIGETGF